MRLLIGLTALALLGACGGNDEDALNADENKALNEAAEMLDASPDSLGAGEETTLGNGDAPAESAETGDLMVSDNAAANQN
jgi:hypothetical protein